MWLSRGHVTFDASWPITGYWSLTPQTERHLARGHVGGNNQSNGDDGCPSGCVNSFWEAVARGRNVNSATPRTRLCLEDPFLIDPAARAAGRLSASSSCPLAANLEQAVTSDTLVERGESQGSGCAKFRILVHFLMWEALPPPPSPFTPINWTKKIPQRFFWRKILSVAHRDF